MIATPSLSIMGTFLASVRSVGTACTLAMVGVYLHRRGFLEGDAKRAMALLSQQVTFPLFLFTKIVYCNQDWSSNPCPDVRNSIREAWLLLLWPVYVVVWGMIVGQAVVLVTRTPREHTKAVWAACAFANSTGLPITLLTVVHANFPETSDLGRIDPSLFLSVYLLVYPIIQWALGGWLLGTDGDAADNKKLNTKMGGMGEQAHSLGAPVPPQDMLLIVPGTTANGSTRHRKKLPSADEGLYMSQVDLIRLAQTQSKEEDEDKRNETVSTREPDHVKYHSAPATEPTCGVEESESERLLLAEKGTSTLASADVTISPTASGKARLRFDTLRDNLGNVAGRVLQPPVVGAIAGIVVATTPLRGIFVDLENRASAAPLQWFFDALYSVGLSAVPINMIILGCNLSASFISIRAQFYESIDEKRSFFPMPTMMGIVVGKMIILPLIGVASTLFLRRYVLDMPDDIDGAFYLVLMIVFLTPTGTVFDKASFLMNDGMFQKTKLT